MPDRLAARVTPAINHGTSGGYRKGCRCDECHEAKREERRQYRLKYPEKLKAKDRAYYYSNLERQAAKNRDWKLRNKYGIDSATYAELLDFQSLRCALCLRKATDAHRSGDPLCVDHCHATGAVRGLLCYPCNTELGRAESGQHPVTALQAEYLAHTPYSLWVSA